MTCIALPTCGTACKLLQPSHCNHPQLMTATRENECLYLLNLSYTCSVHWTDPDDHVHSNLLGNQNSASHSHCNYCLLFSSVIHMSNSAPGLNSCDEKVVAPDFSCGPLMLFACYTTVSARTTHGKKKKKKSKMLPTRRSFQNCNICFDRTHVNV